MQPGQRASYRMYRLRKDRLGATNLPAACCHGWGSGRAARQPHARTVSEPREVDGTWPPRPP